MTELRRSTPDIPSRLANDERYRVLADTAPDAIVTVDADSIILSVNPATETIFGWTADEMIGKSLTMLMPERMRERHRMGMSRYLQSGKRKLDWRSVRAGSAHCRHRADLGRAHAHTRRARGSCAGSGGGTSCR